MWDDVPEVSDNSSEAGDKLHGPPETPAWRTGGRRPLTNTPQPPIATLEALYSDNFVINNLDDEPVILKADPGCRPGTIEFILGQFFYDRGPFHDMLKDFAILNNFGIGTCQNR